MLVTDHFVYLHLHKSGGTFVNEVLLRHVPGARMLGYPLPRSHIPPQYRHLPLLGFVRNPWSYYVSWYHFQLSLPRQNHLFRCVSDDGRLGFGDTIRRLVTLGSDDELLDRVAAGLPQDFVGHGLNLPSWALAPLRGSGLGFYSFLYHHIYGGEGGSGSAPLYVGRTESLREDFFAFLKTIRYDPSRILNNYLLDKEVSNKSPHGKYAEYFDQPLRDLVWERDRQLIEMFGYRFE